MQRERIACLPTYLEPTNNVQSAEEMPIRGLCDRIPQYRLWASQRPLRRQPRSGTKWVSLRLTELGQYLEQHEEAAATVAF